jgi:hypothetical protein
MCDMLFQMLLQYNYYWKQILETDCTIANFAFFFLFFLKQKLL